MKCVIILDEALTPGLAANTAAALGLSLGSHIPGLTGPDAVDRDGCVHQGITAVPIPVLHADAGHLSRLFTEACAHRPQLTALGFSAVAQSCHHYEEYLEKLRETPSEALQYRGLCLYGPRKTVSRLSGQLKLLK